MVIMGPLADGGASEWAKSNPIFPSRVADQYLSAPMTSFFGRDYHSYLSVFETNTYIY